MSKAAVIYDTILDAKRLSVAVQQRILDFATLKKDVALLVKLASHPSLDTSIDEQLRTVTAAAVVAARVSRKERTETEILSILTREKRVSVLSAIASNPALSVEAQRVLAENASHKAVLVALIGNVDAQESIRRDAAARYIELSRTPSDGSMNSERVDTLTVIDEHLEGFLAGAAKTSNDIEVLFAAARRGELGEAEQHRLVAGYVSRYAIGLASRGDYMYGSTETQLEFGLLAEQLCERGHIGEDARKELVRTLDSIIARFDKGSYIISHFTNIRTAVQNASKSRYLDLDTRIAAATTVEDLEGIVVDLRHSYLVSNDLPALLLENLAGKIAASPLSTVEQVAAVFDCVRFPRAQGLLTSTDDPGKQAAIFVELNFNPVSFDGLIGSVNDPDALVRALIANINLHERTYLVRPLVQSSYFKAEHRKLFSLDALLNGGNPDELGDILVELLEPVLVQPEAAETLETLSGEFKGSVEELLHLSRAL